MPVQSLRSSAARTTPQTSLSRIGYDRKFKMGTSGVHSGQSGSRQQPSKATIFVASASEASKDLNALTVLLGKDTWALIEPWNSSPDFSGRPTLLALLEIAVRIDFAIVLYTGDDLVQSKGHSSTAQRSCELDCHRTQGGLKPSGNEPQARLLIRLIHATSLDIERHDIGSRTLERKQMIKRFGILVSSC